MGKRYGPELKQKDGINEKVHMYSKPFDHPTYVNGDKKLSALIWLFHPPKQLVPSSTYNLLRNSSLRDEHPNTDLL